MFVFTLIATFIGSYANANVDLPARIQCSSDESDGSRFLYSFDILNEQIEGADRKIVIDVTQLLPISREFTPYGRDIRRHENVVVWAKISKTDDFRLDLLPSGFLEIVNGKDALGRDSFVRYKTPNGYTYRPPFTKEYQEHFAPNCLVPEPRAGVGN